MSSYVYILTNKWNTILYIGSTTDLVQRVYSHKEKFLPGFTNKYNITKLVYYEIHESRVNAYHRERQMKKWRREWKIRLIEENNPEWNDLYTEII
ncbi:MAG: GIY-YIG nuclease family protein [Calditrichaeota bacterium]|nr:MAG: GIY-YIG nuclease family protein [Calditrichota bacterium]